MKEHIPNIEDEKLSRLFSAFDPQLPSDFGFMEKFKSNLKAVETVKQQTADLRSRNRKAVAIAAFAGFIAGFLLSAFMPSILSVVAGWHINLPDIAWCNAIADHLDTVVWILAGLTTAAVALGSYELSFSMLRARSLEFRGRRGGDF